MAPSLTRNNAKKASSSKAKQQRRQRSKVKSTRTVIINERTTIDQNNDGHTSKKENIDQNEGKPDDELNELETCLATTTKSNTMMTPMKTKKTKITHRNSRPNLNTTITSTVRK